MSTATTRGQLGSMPDELYRAWIEPEIESHGWPFVGDEIEVLDPTWSKYLRGFGPGFWKAVRWSRVHEFVKNCPIEGRAINLAHALASVGRTFVQTGFTEPTLVRSSPQKVAALAEAIRTSENIPVPLVCLARENEWWLMDGQHRLAALFMLEKQHAIPLDCWLGTNAL